MDNCYHCGRELYKYENKGLCIGCEIAEKKQVQKERTRINLIRGESFA